MLTNFSYFDAVKIGEGLLLVRLPKNMYTYTVDGVTINIDYAGNPIVVSEGAEILEVTHPDKVVTSYTRPDGTVISKDEHDKLVYENMGRYYDADGDPAWPSLEREFECRRVLKELEGYEPVYEQPPATYTEVDINVIGSMIDIGSPYIEAAINVNCSNRENGFFRVDATAAAVARFAELKVEHPDHHFENDDFHHDHLRFAKIDGNFAFKDSYPFNRNSFKYFTTVEGAREELDIVRECVDTCVSRAIADHKNDASQGQLVEALSLFRSVQPTPETEKYYRRAMELLERRVRVLDATE